MRSGSTGCIVHNVSSLIVFAFCDPWRQEALDQAKKAATAMKGKDLRELSFLQSTIICNRAAVRLVWLV